MSWQKQYLHFIVAKLWTIRTIETTESKKLHKWSAFCQRMINVPNNWLRFVEDLYSAKMNSVKVIDEPIKELRTIYINYVIM